MSAEARPSITRRDPSGEIRRRLDEQIAAGVALCARASLIASSADLALFAREHRKWVLECLPVVGTGFEPESAGEFLYASSRISDDVELSCAAKAALRASHQSVELLRGLRSTLEHRPAP